jgi:short-subunit dehydrogenase
MRVITHKRALITGAASGIGRALAQQLASRGTHLVLVDRDASGLQQAAEALQSTSVDVETHVLDLAYSERIAPFCEALFARQLEIDILINNAGVVHYGPTEAMDSQDLERVLAVNLVAPLLLTQRLLPRLLARPEAHVLNVASIYGWYARRRTAAYHASKFGLVGWSESLRKEYSGRLGITTLCPGFVNTNLFSSGTSSMPDKQIPQPPSWLCTTPEVVAQQAIQALLKNRSLVLVTPLAYYLYYMQRFAPWLLDWLHRNQEASQ